MRFSSGRTVVLAGPGWTLAFGGGPSVGDILGDLRSLSSGNPMPCNVRNASPLRSCTNGAASVIAEGETVALADLDACFPGMRFRMVDEQDCIRRHLRLFVNTDAAGNLDAQVRSGDEMHLICVLSGG